MKKIITMMLMLALVVSMFVVTVSAAPATSVTVNGVVMNNGDYLAAGESTTSQTRPAGATSVAKFTVADGKATLALDNFKIEGEGIVAEGDLVIKIKGENEIKTTSSIAVKVNNSTLTIWCDEGVDAKLSVEGGSYGIQAKDIVLSRVAVTANSSGVAAVHTDSLKLQKGATLVATEEDNNAIMTGSIDLSGNSSIVADGANAGITSKNNANIDLTLEKGSEIETSSLGNGVEFNTSADVTVGVDPTTGKIVAVNCEHTGGTATCAAKAICSECGLTYGDVDTKNGHNWFKAWANDKEGHWHNCHNTGCPVTEKTEKDGWGVHTPNTDDGDCTTPVLCSVCERQVVAAETAHSFNEKPYLAGGEVDAATCVEKAYYYVQCDNCDVHTNDKKVAVGEVDPTAHTADTTREMRRNAKGHAYYCVNCNENDPEKLPGYAPHTPNADDGDCTTEIRCSVCNGTTTADKEAHAYSTEWTTDGENHWRVCTNKNCEKKDSFGPHNGGTATCVELAVCADCNTSYGSYDFSDAGHTWDTEWTKGETAHWHKCLNGCAFTKNEALHSATPVANCTVAEICECGHVVKAAEADHVWEQGWLYNDAGHYHKCSDTKCEVTTTPVAHTGTDDKNCETEVKCDNCPYVITPAKTHEWSGYQSNETIHWVYCKNNGCETIENKGTHELNYYAENGVHYGECKICQTTGLAKHDPKATAKRVNCTDSIFCECGLLIEGPTASAHKIEHIFVDSTYHTEKCSNSGCTYAVSEKHSGGYPATCYEKSICDECGKAYGSLNKNNHIGPFRPSEWKYDKCHHWRICMCGEKVQIDEHKVSKWKIGAKPTYFQDGYAFKDCEICHAVLIKVIIPATGNWKDDGNFTPEVKMYTITAEAGKGGTITNLGKLEVAEGSDETYKITPNSGYVVADVKVDGKSVGAVSEYTFKNVKADHKIVVTFKDAPWDNPFIDVSEKDSFYEAVKFVYEFDLMQGTSPAHFSPYTTMTRAMFVTVLGRLSGVDVSSYTGSSFTDCVEGLWYSAYVEWAASQGIVKGYDTGAFGVNDEITIEQACVILARYAKYIGIDIESDFLLAFADASKVAPWAYAEMQWAVENGIYTGTNGKLVPQNPAKRYLVAEFLYEFVTTYIYQPSK